MTGGGATGDRRTAWFVTLAGLGLLPWLAWLVLSLPRHYTAHHYWLGWVGFDLAMAVVLIRTGRHSLRGDPRLPRVAATAVTLLVMDAWFDVLNAATTTDRITAAALAACFELPLAALLWRLTRPRPADHAAPAPPTARRPVPASEEPPDPTRSP